MEVLFEAEQIAKTLEECRAEIATLNEKLKLEQAQADLSRSKLSKAASRKIWAITIVSAVIGTFIVPILLTVVFGIVAYFIAFLKIGEPDLTEHQTENDLAAEAYICEHVTPL